MPEPENNLRGERFDRIGVIGRRVPGILVSSRCYGPFGRRGVIEECRRDLDGVRRIDYRGILLSKVVRSASESSAVDRSGLQRIDPTVNRGISCHRPGRYAGSRVVQGGKLQDDAEADHSRLDVAWGREEGNL